MSRRQQSPVSILIVLFTIALIIGLVLRVKKDSELRSVPINGYTSLESTMLKRVQENYGEKIEKFTLANNLPSSYFKALIALECGGHLPSGNRYEKLVFSTLKLVKEKKKKNYGSITIKQIGDASDGALKNLSTSWGPFQLMGYQCLELGLHVKDIRGTDAIKWGIHWINKSYGSYLKKGQFKNAFHKHNTGQPYPKTGHPFTTNPNYVKNGLRYMNYFESH